MEHLKKFNFLIVDDSPFDCLIAEKLINATKHGDSITKITDPNAALEMIKATRPAMSDTKTVIFLDLQMPVMNGFEFIEQYETLPYSIRENYVILLTTSSVNQNDVLRGSSYESVRYFINKPLTVTKLLEVFSDL